MVRLCACLVAAALGGCPGTETRTLRLERIPGADPACGAAGDGQAMLITALGAGSGEEVAFVAVEPGDVALEGFPATTAALAVEVLGQDGEVRTIGRTARFAVSDLESGASVKVFMAPPRGFCPVGPLAAARDRPQLVHAGDRILVAGGFDESGEPVRSLELYDPFTGEFSPVPGGGYWESGAAGLSGASVTELSDGRVLLAGGAFFAYQLYHPEAGALAPAAFLTERRAHHVAVPLPDGRVLLASGCTSPDERDGRCAPANASPRTVILDLESGGLDDGPPLSRPRIGGSAVLEPGGRILLVGGIGEDGQPQLDAERIDPLGGLPSQVVPGVHGELASLASGSALFFSTPPGAPPQLVAFVLPAGASDATASPALGAGRAGATLTPLEDGRVLVLGGAGGTEDAEALYYLPVDSAFAALPAAPATRRQGHAAIRLDDGTVLAVGGTDESGAALADAWIFRPDLVGPLTAGLTVTFEGERAEHVVPRDPARAVRERPEGAPGRLRLVSSGPSGDVPSEWAVVAGPVAAAPELRARVRAEGGAGAAAIFSVRGPGELAFVKFLPGQRAELLRLVDGLPLVAGCLGERLGDRDLEQGPDGVSPELVFRTAGGEIVSELGGRQVLRCPAPDLGSGLSGLGVFGAAGAELIVESISVSR